MNAFYKNLESQETNDWNTSLYIDNVILSSDIADPNLTVKETVNTIDFTYQLMHEYLKECIAEQF